MSASSRLPLLARNFMAKSVRSSATTISTLPTLMTGLHSGSLATGTYTFTESSSQLGLRPRRSATSRDTASTSSVG